MSWKRRVADLIERTSGNLVVPPYELHLVHEVQHLARTFAHCGVDCVFDVGANRGQYRRMLRERVGFQGFIVSFEPIPELAAALAEDARHDPKWFVENLALDREAGPAAFHVMADSEFSSLRAPAADQPGIFHETNRVAREVQVIRSTLRDKFPEWQERLGFREPFLKMDTQGNDLAVLEGGAGIVDRFSGLQSELAIRKLYSGAAGYAETLEAYRKAGFELSAFVPNNAGHFPVLVEMDCIMVHRRHVDPRHH